MLDMTAVEVTPEMVRGDHRWSRQVERMFLWMGGQRGPVDFMRLLKDLMRGDRW